MYGRHFEEKFSTVVTGMLCSDNLCQPSCAISGRCASNSGVTVNSSVMIGAGPFSRLSSSEASYPAIAICIVTHSVNSTASAEP